MCFYACCAVAGMLLLYDNGIFDCICDGIVEYLCVFLFSAGIYVRICMYFFVVVCTCANMVDGMPAYDFMDQNVCLFVLSYACVLVSMCANMPGC